MRLFEHARSQQHACVGLGVGMLGLAGAFNVPCHRGTYKHILGKGPLRVQQGLGNPCHGHCVGVCSSHPRALQFKCITSWRFAQTAAFLTEAAWRQGLEWGGGWGAINRRGQVVRGIVREGGDDGVLQALLPLRHWQVHTGEGKGRGGCGEARAVEVSVRMWRVALIKARVAARGAQRPEGWKVGVLDLGFVGQS